MSDLSLALLGKGVCPRRRACVSWRRWGLLLDLVGLYSELRRGITAREIRGEPVCHLRSQFHRVETAIREGEFIERN